MPEGRGSTARRGLVALVSPNGATRRGAASPNHNLPVHNDIGSAGGSTFLMRWGRSLLRAAPTRQTAFPVRPRWPWHPLCRQTDRRKDRQSDYRDCHFRLHRFLLGVSVPRKDTISHLCQDVKPYLEVSLVPRTPSGIVPPPADVPLASFSWRPLSSCPLVVPMSCFSFSAS